MSEKQESSASLGDDYESKKKWGTGVQGEDEVGDIADSLCNLSTSGGDKNPVAMEDDEVADILCNMKMGLVNKPRSVFTRFCIFHFSLYFFSYQLNTRISRA